MAGGRAGEHHIYLRPVDTSKTEDALRAAETACALAIQLIPEEAEVSQELLIYPEGEVDAESISETDLEELQPEKDPGFDIVDFYIRYLERGLSPEHGKLFYFFKSRFFSTLLESTTSTFINPCKVDYEQLRKWSKEVNLFEKDYVFLPILESSHWSLVIICNLRSLTCAPDDMASRPCIVHLDPIEGRHSSFEGLIRSYIMQAWMERFQSSVYRDQLLALAQMVYVQAEVPRQHNSHDCGLYVLSYIEAFLRESTSPGFSFPSSERGMHFTGPNFSTEVSTKRLHIQNLIHGLIDVSRERSRKRRAINIPIHELLQASRNLRAFLNDEGDEGNSGACTEDVRPASPTVSHSPGGEINHASIHEDAMSAPHHQSSGTSSENNEPSSGPPMEPAELETECETMSPKEEQQQGELEWVWTVGPTQSGSPNVEPRDASSHEDSFRVQHQPSSGVSRLDDGLLDGREHRHAEVQRVIESTPDKHQHRTSAKAPCVDLSESVKGVYKRGRNMTTEETWMMLSCKREGRFRKGNRGVTDWYRISEEMGKKWGSPPSGDQCRLRYDTLLKAYKTYEKHCTKTGKTFSEITSAERVELRPATTLSEEWYAIMAEISDKAENPQKRLKLSSPAPNAPYISEERPLEDGAVVLDSACGAVEVSLPHVTPASVLSSVPEDLRCTLLHLVQECSLRCFMLIDNKFTVENACRRLAILQDRDPREILNYFFRLWELKLVGVEDTDSGKGVDLAAMDLWKRKRWFVESRVSLQVSEEVFPKNPHLETYCFRFPIPHSSLENIRVLWLSWCRSLEHLDMTELPSLRSLTVSRCLEFKSVTGWEVARGLGSLEINGCPAYDDFPEVRHLSSLRDFSVSGREWNPSAIPWHLSELRQCAKLQRLEVWCDASLSEIADLETLKELKFLDYLSLGRCTFSSIRGLSGLQALTTLRLAYCWRLRSVPELRSLTRLTHLDMSWSGIDDVAGVGELHSLTWLDLTGCFSLERLPCLGNLTALVHLDLRFTRVTEIPGRERLRSTIEIECDW